MSQIPSTSNLSGGAQDFGSKTALNDLDIGDFLDLMIAELQNQDPLNPLENDELVAQISQIREVGATDKLTQTLDAVLLGQNVSSATSLIGQEVKALTPEGQTVAGVVDRVTISNGVPEIHINADSRTVPSSTSGRVEEGTYRYKAVFERPDGKLGAIDIGPITTTGRNGLDASILITNLPATPGGKSLYRTDATGEGPYYLVNNIADGSASSYIDSASNGELSSATLGLPTIPEYGGRRFTTTLKNVSEIRPLTN